MSQAGRRRLLFGAGAILVAPTASKAQPVKTPRLGYLTPNSYTASAAIRTAFEQGLRENGFVAGRTVFLEARYGDGNVDLLPGLVAELVRLKVDIIFTTSGPGAVVAKKATNEIPIVFMSVYDPVHAGLVASLARPGGNATGVTNAHAELAGKRTQLLSELSPQDRRIGALASSSAETEAILELMRSAASTLAVQLHVERVASAEDFERALASMKNAGVRVVMPVPHPLFYSHQTRLVGIAAKTNLVLLGWTNEFAEAGAPVSYGASNATMARLAASYVARILKGARPADLPVQAPTKVELVINQRSAQALGLKVPRALLVRADRVIE